MKRYAVLLVFWLLLRAMVPAQNIAVTATNLFEGEPTLAVHPSNSQQLTAAWIGIVIGQGTVIRTSHSSDGGATWSTPNYAQHVVSGNSSADPSLQYDLNGNVYLCYIDYDKNNFTNGQIVVRKSTDNGATWGAAIEAISITDCPGKYCVDRPWMEIDRSGGPNTGTIYVTSMNPDQPALVSPPYNPYLAVSTDGGLSFNTPRVMDTTGYLAGSLIAQPMPSPAIGGDGTFYASYPSYDTAQSPFAHIYLASSVTQGIGLDHDDLYTVLMAGVTDPLAKKAGKLIADPTIPQHLVMLNLSEANGDADIFYMETFDALNWSAPERLNQDAIGNGKMQDLVWGEFNERGDLAVCWRDRRNASGSGYQTETEIYGAVRMKDSTAFGTDFAISSQQVAHDVILEGSGNDFLGVRFRGDTLYTIWGDVRTGTLNIYINRYSIATATSVTSQVWSEGPGIKLYPNPATDVLQIEHFERGSGYALYDAAGRKLRELHADSLSLHALSPGTYFIVFQAEGRSYSLPFVTQ